MQYGILFFQPSFQKVRGHDNFQAKEHQSAAFQLYQADLVDFTLFEYELDILFELGGTLDIINHESKSSRSSSMDLKTLPTPGFLSSSDS